jgi:uncharacterized membrane protein YgdD (TMEM256/DUF423 family)
MSESKHYCVNWVLFIGALFGLSAVGMGAYADHGLSATFDSANFYAVMTAVRYHQYYALLIVALGLISWAPISSKMSRRIALTAACFFVGALFFSGGIYLSRIWGIPRAALLTPYGGVVILVSWALLAWNAVTLRFTRCS